MNKLHQCVGLKLPSILKVLAIMYTIQKIWRHEMFEVLNICNKSYRAGWIWPNGLNASVVSPLKMVVQLHTELLPVARAPSPLCRWSKGQLCLSSGWSYCARRSACCLCSRGRDENSSEGAEQEKPCKSGRIQRPWAPASLSITKFKRSEEKTDSLSDNGTRVTCCFVLFWLLHPQRWSGSDWAVSAPNKRNRWRSH